MNFRRRIEPFVTPLFRLMWRFTRGLTLGVRGLVVNGEGRVLLIEHTYIKGWYMPGGGVERGEPVEHALAREMMEEAGIEVIGRPRLLSIHDNGAKFPGDHVLVYRIEHYREGTPTQTGEILNRGWFAPDALPEETTPSTRRRIAEALAAAESDLAW
jgi:8-oxo-dGTP pyrophosphatase MutT (NUDIX family)